MREKVEDQEYDARRRRGWSATRAPERRESMRGVRGHGEVRMTTRTAVHVFAVVALAGAMRGAGGADDAVVRGACFPAAEEGKMLFGGRRGFSSLRIDVDARDGSFSYRGKSADETSDALSVSGVHYAPYGGAPLDTNAPSWVAWPSTGYWRPPELYCDSRGLVALSGLLKGPESAKSRFGAIVATLPERCRPQGRLIFPVRSDYGDARIDVEAGGAVRWIAGPDSSNNEVTLSGVTFTSASVKKTNLALENGWHQPKRLFENARYVCEDGLVIVSGLVERFTTLPDDPLIARLPAGCRPNRGALVFSVMSKGEKSESVVIDTDGNIKWTGVSKGNIDATSFWVSLSGIVFSNGDKTMYDPNARGTPKFKLPTSFYANPSYSCDAWRGALVVLEGMVFAESPDSGDVMMKLPIDPTNPRPRPSAKIENPVKVVSAYSVDFGIHVEHSTCRPSVDNCELDAPPATNYDLEKIRCEVRVQKQGENCLKFGSHMPCRNWDNFQPSTLSTTDESGQMVPGDYDVLYSCYGAYEKRAQMMKLHSFRVEAGCDPYLPKGGNGGNLFENVARHLLLSSPDLHDVDCEDKTSVYRAKEAVFRLYDNDPEDGVLSYKEILAALEKQSTDNHIVTLWNEQFDGNLDLKPSHVMNARVDDMACGAGSIVYDSTVYPSDNPGRETDEEECEGNAENMRVAWHYNTTLSAGDYTCLYIDGVLYDKLAVTFDQPKSGAYSKVQRSLYAPTELTDIRPISGMFEDVQQSLVANFLFDKGDTSSLIVSASPLVVGQTGSKPTLVPIGMTRTLSACTGGDGGRCLKEVPFPGKGEYGFAYKGTLPTLDVAITAWVHSSCRVGAPDVETIALFNGSSDSIHFYLDRQSSSSSTMDLKVVFTANNQHIPLTIAGVKCREWHQVGFSLNRRDGLVLLMNPEGSTGDTVSSDTYKTIQLSGAGEILRRMSTLRLLGAIGVEFDDVRIYAGQVSKATFVDAYRCGRRILCAQRAHATPSSRRVVCASVATQKGGLKPHSDYFCTSAMYYDGSAIDVDATLGMSGVTFSFRDTAVGESSFEMLRRPFDATVATAKYETVIQMDGDLKSCGNKFSSITFLDREAGSKPNLEWYYKVRTKMPRSSGSSGYVSTTHYFKAPWIATLAGKVHAGRSQTPVPHVRVCADFVRAEGILALGAQEDTITNLALYMKTEHSGNVTRTADESTFLITDGDASVSSGVSLMKQNEYLRVELSRWSTVRSVEVCADRVSDALKSAKVYVHDEGGVGASEFGKECVVSESGAEINGACVSFACNTNDIDSFHGKHVTVVNTGEDDVNVTEILVLGFQTRCAFTSVTNKFGSYSMELRDTSGRMPEEAMIVTAAYKEDLVLTDANLRTMVVHVFDKNAAKPSLNAKEVFTTAHLTSTDLPKGNIIQILHQNQIKHDFSDDTTVVVKGAVLFPKIRTAGSTKCGLFEAVIQVKEVDGEDDVIEVKTDESGRFEIPLTRGNSFRFNASFPKHTICYAGNEIQDAAHTTSCDGRSLTATISHVNDGHTIYFTDVTQGNIDLGVYQGQCDALYSGVKFKIEPINGCHDPLYVTSENVASWMTNVGNLPKDKFPDEKTVPKNTRAWPFAAMDYSIVLESGADVSGIQDMIKEESWNEGCATEDGDMVTFFRRRNALERLAAMRNSSDWVQIRYNYHGFICVDISEQYIPKIENKNEVCYDQTGDSSGGLTLKHFLGISLSEDLTIKKTKSIRVKVFELHASSGTYAKCFAALPDEAKDTGSTKVKIRQDVSDPQDTECHPARGGGESCDFQVVLDDEGYLIFPGSNTTELIINAGQPNLAGNHRRTVRIEVERNDLYRSIAATTVRELIPLGSKSRIGEGLSDDTFWATVPFDGLVYTVVHDPPGGNSYAELSSGSEVRIEWALASTRAMTVETGSYVDSAFGFMAQGKFGMNVGYTAEASTELAEWESKVGVNGQVDVDGPNFSVESESSAGWDLTLTTDRVISSSQDPALPGRSGDVILGGGIELVYKIADILDLQKNENGRFCLSVNASITWLPRKPTTYVLMIHSIEAQILPNLKFLLATAASSSFTDASGKAPGIEWPEYIEHKIASWERTLRWAAPENATEIRVSLTGSDSVFGKNLETKMNDNGGWGYNELFTQDDDFSDVAEDLAKEWASGALIDAREGGYMFMFASPTMFPTARLPVIAQIALLSPLAYAQKARLLPYMRNNDAKVSDDPGHFPYADFSIVHPIVRSDKLKPNYDETLKDVSGETIYSYGMNDFAVGDMNTSSAGFPGIADGIHEDGSNFTTKPGDSTQIISSMTGGSARTSMSGSETTQVLLTFGGGGGTTEFSFNSREANTDYKSHITFKFDGGEDFAGGLHNEGEIAAGPGGFYYDQNVGMKYGWTREVANDRTFFWNKYGVLTTKYSLGDPEYGDKFVVGVGSDRRFGTPVFVTKGGRSMCPGELGTVFRESGVTLEIPLKTATKAENLNPGERAIFEVVIKNGSPYREAGKFALRLVDGLSASLKDIVSAAYARAAAKSADAQAVYDEVIAFADSTVAKSSEDVARIASAAKHAKGLEGATPRSVADAIYREASTAPQEFFEMRDSVFSVNGNGLSIGDYRPLKFVGGDALERQKFISQQQLSIAVTPGYATRSIRYLQLQLVSLCESEMDLYRDPIAHTINIDSMSWSQPCPKVQFDESTASKYMFSSQSQRSSGQLSLTVNNPDRYLLWPDESLSDPALMNAQLKLVRLQYRPVSGGEWITAKDEGSPETDKKFNLLCAASRTEGCKFDWKINNQFEKLLSGFKDNVYELRVKNFCFGGPSLADPSVHEFVGDQRLTLTVDTKAPMIKRYVTFGERYFGVELDEAIDCSDQEVEVRRKYATCDDATSSVNAAVSSEELDSFDFKCAQTPGGITLMVGFPQTHAGTFTVTVSGVRDVAGNALESFAFEARAWCALARFAKHAASSRTAALGLAPTMHERGVSRDEVARIASPGVVQASVILLVCASAAFGATTLRRRRASVKDTARDVPTYGATL